MRLRIDPRGYSEPTGEIPDQLSISITTSKHMNITIAEIAELVKAFGINQPAQTITQPHPMLGKRCLIRTYSAGVHIGDVVWVNPANSMELKLANSLRLWSWEKGGLSLSDIANKGVVKARLNRTGDVFLTNAIEYIPTTTEAEATYAKFIE